MAYDQSDPTQQQPNDPGHESINDAVSQIYQTALGRAPESADVVNQWIQGTGGDLAKIQQGIYGTPEAQAYSKAQIVKGQANATPTASSTSGMPAGIDPHLAALYQKAGITPGDRGSGFADWQYWQNEALNNAGGNWDYITKRLGDDLAGTGTDQPTGTPGSGPWSSSGAADRASQQAAGTPPPPSPIDAVAPFQPKSPAPYNPQGPTSPQAAPPNGLPDPQVTYGPNMGNSGNFWQGRTPMDFSKQQVESSPQQTQSTDLIRALMSRIKLGGNGLNFNK